MGCFQSEREEQEHSLKVCVLVVVIVVGCFFFIFSVLETPEESWQGQQFKSQQGAGVEGRVLAVSEGSYLSAHHWLLTYLTAGQCNNSLGLRSLPTEPETQMRLTTPQRLKHQNKFHQKI